MLSRAEERPSSSLVSCHLSTRKPTFELGRRDQSPARERRPQNIPGHLQSSRLQTPASASHADGRRSEPLRDTESWDRPKSSRLDLQKGERGYPGRYGSLLKF